MEINVLYATDNNYLHHAAASIYSLLDNNKDIDRINLYIIDDKISDENKQKLEQMIKSFGNRTITFYPFEKLQTKLELNDKSGFAPIGYARLFISDITDSDKILYLDCDTIVNNSIKDLWTTDISEYYFAGVQDNPSLFAAKIVGMTEDDRYINSGMMLINLKKWKEENVEKRIIDMIHEYRGFVPHHDQGIVNGICKGKILILPPKYNTMSQFFLFSAKQIKDIYKMNNYYSEHDIAEAKSNPVIIHYLCKFFNRPWFVNSTHPLKNLYIDYAKKTPFGVKLLNGKLKKSVVARKFVYETMPFPIYKYLERFLDAKRRKNLKKQYDFLSIDF